LNLPFTIPFYGDHVSLFTITAVLTSFAISIYSMSMTPDQGNPVLKYMPYFFPIILLFIFNKLPAGLTWYYTVSNIITLVLQFVIQNYIITTIRYWRKWKPTVKSRKQNRNGPNAWSKCRSSRKRCRRCRSGAVVKYVVNQCCNWCSFAFTQLIQIFDTSY
jgi:YidC/Oxa1 family membrane protein insertase